MLHCSVIINSVRSSTADFHPEWNLINEYMKTHVGLPPKPVPSWRSIQRALDESENSCSERNLVCSYPGGVVSCHYHPENRGSMFLRNMDTHLKTTRTRNRE